MSPSSRRQRCDAQRENIFQSRKSVPWASLGASPIARISFPHVLFRVVQPIDIQLSGKGESRGGSMCPPGLELFVPIWPRRPYVLCVQVLEGLQGLKQGIVDNVENPACLDGNFGIVQLCLLEKKLDWSLSWNKLRKGQMWVSSRESLFPFHRRDGISNYEALSIHVESFETDRRKVRSTYLEILIAPVDNWKGNDSMNVIR